MATLTNITVDASPAWTPVPIVGNPPALLWNVSDEAMTIRFGGAGDTHAIAAGKGLAVPTNLTIEAQCASGSKTLQVLVGGVRPIGGGLPTGTGGMAVIGSMTPNRIVSPGPGDLGVEGDLEVDGVSYFDGGGEFRGAWNYQGNVNFWWGFSGTRVARLQGDYTNAIFSILLDPSDPGGGHVLFVGGTANHLSWDPALGALSHPSVVIQSVNATAGQHMLLQHNGADARLVAGTGGLTQPAPQTPATPHNRLANSEIMFTLDETGNNVDVTVKYSDGTQKSTTFALT